MLGLRAASSSSSSSSTSNTKSKSKSNETSGRSEVLSQAKSYLSLASDELQAKLAKARLRAEGTKAKLAQIEADAELAMLLQIQGTLSSSVGPSNPHLGDPQTANSKIKDTLIRSASKQPSSSSSAPSSSSAFETTARRSPDPPRPQSSTGQEKNPSGSPRLNSSTGPDKIPSRSPRPQSTGLDPGSPRLKSSTGPGKDSKNPPGSPSPDEAQESMLLAQLSEVRARLEADRVLQQSAPEDILRNELSNLKLELELLRKTALNAPLAQASIAVAKEADIKSQSLALLRPTRIRHGATESKLQ